MILWFTIGQAAGPFAVCAALWLAARRFRRPR